MEYIGSGCYDGFYRIGKHFEIGDGQALNLDLPERKHKGILIRPLSTVQRTLNIEFYGTPFGGINNTVTIGHSAATAGFNAPYIIPCRIKLVSTSSLETPDNKFIITLLN